MDFFLYDFINEVTELYKNKKKIFSKIKLNDINYALPFNRTDKNRYGKNYNENFKNQIKKAGVNRLLLVDLCRPCRYLCDFAEQIQGMHLSVRFLPTTFGCVSPRPNSVRIRLPSWMQSFC